MIIVQKSSPSDILFHQAFRYELFHTIGFIPANNEQLDIDGYDEFSDHFFAYKDDQMVGCCRLTYLALCQTYTDIFIDNPPYPCDRRLIVEVNRMGVHPSQRNLRSTLEIRLGLTNLMCKVADKKGLTHSVTGVHADYYRLLKRQGKIPFQRHDVAFKQAQGVYEGYTTANESPLVFLTMQIADFLDPS